MVRSRVQKGLRGIERRDHVVYYGCMSTIYLTIVQNLWTRLLPLLRKWSFSGRLSKRVAPIRQEIILNLHRHFWENLRPYRDQTTTAQLGLRAPWDEIAQNLLSPTELFKSYASSYLNPFQSQGLTDWVNSMSIPPLKDPEAENLEAWIKALENQGRFTVVSSGSSGKLSIIPRTNDHQNLMLKASLANTAGTLARRKLLPWWTALGARFMPLQVSSSRKIPQGLLKGWDAYFLDFAEGRTGNQLLAGQLASLFGSVHYLINRALPPSLLSALVRGPTDSQQEAELGLLHRESILNRPQLWDDLLAKMQESKSLSRPVFLFGTPVFLLELLCHLELKGLTLKLPRGSLVLYGGGWKNFSGEPLSPEDLEIRLSSTLGVPSNRLIEGYAMTEMSALTLKCPAGWFHIPPHLEALRLNQELEVQETLEGPGLFGYLDSAALSYPGWLVSGDEVDMAQGRCTCGIEGPRLRNIHRSARHEAKGCGGIMGALKA